MDIEESGSNNRHKVKTTASPTDLVLHYDKKMIYFIYAIYIYTYAYMRICLGINRYIHILIFCHPK